MRPRKPGASALRNLLEDWIDILVARLRPRDKRATVIYDWNGKCKYCGKKKD